MTEYERSRGRGQWEYTVVREFEEATQLETHRHTRGDNSTMGIHVTMCNVTCLGKVL